MASVTEIAPDIFRICTHVPPPLDFQFCQFLVKDEDPLLFHTGLRALFPGVKEAVASLIDPAKLRWIAFSHYEADECGTMNDFLEMAPGSEVACSLTGKLVSVDDMALRPARGLGDDEVLVTGARRLRFLRTPHVPHSWEAGLMFEETTRTLLCSDMGYQWGDVEAVTGESIVERHRVALAREQEEGPLSHGIPYCTLTAPTMARLAELEPRAIATMHGSTFVGDGAAELRGMAAAMQEIMGRPA